VSLDLQLIAFSEFHPMLSISPGFVRRFRSGCGRGVAEALPRGLRRRYRRGLRRRYRRGLRRRYRRGLRRRFRSGYALNVNSGFGILTITKSGARFEAPSRKAFLVLTVMDYSVKSESDFTQSENSSKTKKQFITYKVRQLRYHENNNFGGLCAFRGKIALQLV